MLRVMLDHLTHRLFCIPKYPKGIKKLITTSVVFKRTLCGFQSLLFSKRESKRVLSVFGFGVVMIILDEEELVQTLKTLGQYCQ